MPCKRGDQRAAGAVQNNPIEVAMNAIESLYSAPLTKHAKRTTLFGLLLSALACAPTGALDPAQDEYLEAGVQPLEERAPSTTYEAERRTSQSGCVEAANQAGFTGTGFMDYGGDGSWIEWNRVAASVAGEQSLSFRYANAGANDRSAVVALNGVAVGNLAFAPTGAWTNWRTATLKVMLRAGNNTIRVTAQTGAGGPNIDSIAVTGQAAPGGSIRDLTFGPFSKLNEETTVFNQVSAEYVVYAESHGRNGHNDIDESQSGFVRMVGATLVGYGGGRDKYLALFRVNSATVQIDANGGSPQALFIDTSKTLRVVEARSIDPSIPNVGPQPVPGPNSGSEIIIYAEDEGGKGDRDQYFGSRATKTYGTGDDLLYVFGDNRIGSGGPNGNGAYMRISMR